MTIQILSRQVLCSTAILLALSQAPICAADDLDRPPRLTFESNVDYFAWYQRIMSAGKDPAQNAFHEYSLIHPINEGGDRKKLIAAMLMQSRGRRWENRISDEMRSALEENHKSLMRFKLGANQPFFWCTNREDAERLSRCRSPIQENCHDAARLLLLEAKTVERNDSTSKLDAWVSILRCARQFRNDMMLSSNSLSLGLRFMVYANVVQALQSGDLKKSDMIIVFERLRSTDPCEPDLSRTVIYEWAVALDFIQDIAPGGKLNNNKFRATLGYDPARLFTDQVAPAIEIRDDVDADYARLSNCFVGPLGLGTLDRLRALDQKNSKESARHLILRKTFPTFSKTVEGFLQGEDHRRATLLLVAVHSYKAREQRWPSSLNDLKAEGIEDVRSDILTGSDFVYKPTGHDFILYSIGMDGKDDGGRHDSKWGESPGGGDYVFWPVQDEENPRSAP